MPRLLDPKPRRVESQSYKSLKNLFPSDKLALNFEFDRVVVLTFNFKLARTPHFVGAVFSLRLSCAVISLRAGTHTHTHTQTHRPTHTDPCAYIHSVIRHLTSNNDGNVFAPIKFTRVVNYLLLLFLRKVVKLIKFTRIYLSFCSSMREQFNKIVILFFFINQLKKLFFQLFDS